MSKRALKNDNALVTDIEVLNAILKAFLKCILNNAFCYDF
jgi:hypothetical protein